MAATQRPAQYLPELDRVAWFAPEEARRRVKAAQIPFIDRLIAAVGGESPRRESTHS